MRILKYAVLSVVTVIFLFASCHKNHKQVFVNANYITEEKGKSNFQFVADGIPAPFLFDSGDYDGIKKIIPVFADDVKKVSGELPEIYADTFPESPRAVIIGTLGKNRWIDSLARQKKIETSVIRNKWEASLIQVVRNPFKGVKEALVIAGSDKRGTIYGMFDFSEKIGVSPWYWWADVPVKTKADIYVKPVVFTEGEPAVKYRGIFINDEAPALSGWVYEKYGEFNSEFYYKVFELILRLKGNYLWPAMWGRAFNFNDTLNPVLADELGIVMGTSHHEPMMRAQQEWKMFGSGAWNYEKNRAVLDSFWREGIENMRDHESIVTIGMRGDGDMPMSEEANINLLEEIVSNQRKIIEGVTGKPASSQPQIWALYKEVQEYYDKGMRVPDDVTLLLCDDNWGNVRKLPVAEELKHPGGYGMYYHYDYVGDPRNYKWLNTNLIPRVWEQMNLTYSHGVNKIWIVNVGDIKPMELPISFFLDYAWNPDNWPLEKLPDYTTLWAEKQFGKEYAREIAELLDKYTRYNSRRKPEMLSPETYSLINYREFETVVNDYNELAEKAEKINSLLGEEYHDAFYQMVLFPILACSNLNELYYTVGLNRLYARQKRASTNEMAEKARLLFEKDSLLTYHYNHVLNDGKWNHFMDQTHIGYTYWQQPEFNNMPEVENISVYQGSKMGIAVEGTETWWPDTEPAPSLPEFSAYGPENFYIEVFNQGQKPYTCSLETDNEYIHLSETKLNIKQQLRIEVSINWEKAPEGRSEGKITCRSSNNEITEVAVPVFKPENLNISGNVMAGGLVSIEAENYSEKSDSEGLTWKVIPNYGKTLSGIKTFPANHTSRELTGSNPFLEYTFHSFDTGRIEVHCFMSPTLDFLNRGGLRLGLALNDEIPRTINMHTQGTSQDWNQWVGNNIIQTISEHRISTKGDQILRFYAVDPGVVLQKLVICSDSLKPGYLGP